MTLNELKAELKGQQVDECLESIFKIIKEEALSGKSHIVFYSDSVEERHMKSLERFGYSVRDKVYFYIVSGWV